MAKTRKVYDRAWVAFKALPDLDGQSGRFEAVVSVFGNVDYQGDRVVKGAFKKSIQKWRKQGDPIPIIWSHDWGDPFAHVGAADPNLAEETDVGLKLIGAFDVHKPFASQVFDLVKDRRVREWSFAYDVEKEDKASDGANDLVVLDIIEAGPTLKGANPDTFTIGVKTMLEHAAAVGSAMLTVNQARSLMDLPPLDEEAGGKFLIPLNVVQEAKAGRMLSSKNENALRSALGKMSEALDEVNAVLSGLDKPEVPGDEEEKSRIINITVNGSAVDSAGLSKQIRERLLSLTAKHTGGAVLTEDQKVWLKAEVEAELAAWYAAEAAFKEADKPEWQKANEKLETLLGVKKDSAPEPKKEDSPVETETPDNVKSLDDYKRELGVLTSDVL